mmetsp:Transcript_64140/g.162537  ORF Transcript_64140/g.162537 Transcript_64140/m.162537 type:complete len:254 (-) Transcript_64140:214-975(-)
MHSWCNSERPATSADKSFWVISRSPSELAFFSLAAAMPSLASESSLLANLISSFSPCSIISKACRLLVSVLRAVSSCSSAFSRRSEMVCTMFPDWLSYTAPAGAPTSSSSEELCKKDWSLLASAVLSMEAWTKAPMACTKLLAPFSWSIDAPPFISRSRMPTARCKVSTTSMSSFSSAAKAVCSLTRMTCAALRSASSVEMSPASFSTWAFREPSLATSSSMAALSSPTSAFPVLISWLSLADRSSHHSANSL